MLQGAISHRIRGATQGLLQREGHNSRGPNPRPPMNQKQAPQTSQVLQVMYHFGSCVIVLLVFPIASTAWSLRSVYGLKLHEQYVLSLGI